MRVLLVPELYRPDDATANGSLNDLVTLAEHWLALDTHLHVYWLLPPREAAGYDAAYVHADRERVTLIEAQPLLADHAHGDKFVESGHSEDELLALQSAIYDRTGYVDVVVDQLMTGRYDLYKWVLEQANHREAEVTPVEFIGYVHDLRLPFKRHGQEYPGEMPVKRELLSGLVTDGLWFKAGVDADRMREYGGGYLCESVLDNMLDGAVQTGSPIDFDAYEESYSDEANILHVAGSGWGKKNLDDVLSIGRRLYDRYGVRTLMTNMDPIHPPFADREFVDPYPETSRETYEWALRRGDIAVCASDHETMARTPFEQAASGQVLVLRDRPWVYDCVPDDYRLLGDRNVLGDLAAWAVEHWPAAVAATRRLVKHARTVRSPETCGRRTYEDLRRRVAGRVDRYDRPNDGTIEAVRTALSGIDGAVTLDDINQRTAANTATGDPVLSGAFTLADLIYVLRSLGYRDTGCPGTPAFEPVERALTVDERTTGPHASDQP